MGAYNKGKSNLLMSIIASTLAACGGGGSDSAPSSATATSPAPTSTTPTPTTTTPTPTPTPPPTSTPTPTSSSTYTIGVTVNGLTGTGAAFKLNGTETLQVNAPGGRSNFTATLANAVSYAVQITQQPDTQVCGIPTGGAAPNGTVNGADVNISFTLRRL